MLSRLVISLLATIVPAMAQDLTSVGAQVRWQYENCVYRAANNEFSRAGQKAMAVEQAFQACLTEEQAVIAVMKAISPTDPQLVSTSWIGFKLKLKQAVISKLP